MQKNRFLLLRYSFLVMLVAFLPTFLPAYQQDKYIDFNDQLYEEIINFYRESGQIIPTLDQPWSYRQASWLISRIDVSNLSTASKYTAAKIKAAILEKPLFEEDGLSFNSGLTLTLEAVVPDKFIETGVIPTPYPWDYRWNNRNPLIRFPLLIGLGKHIFAETLFEIMEEPSVPEQEPKSYTNLPGEAYDLYLKIPRTAYINAGGPHWEISFGRTRPKWGSGETGTLLLSGNADWMTGLRARTYFDHFSYTWYTANLSPWFVTGTDPLSDPEKYKQTGASKWFFGHSFEFTLGKSFYLSIREAYIYGGSASIPLDLFNPVMILHNTYPKGSDGETTYTGDTNVGNALVSLETRWAFTPGWELYNSFVLDQAQTPGETGGAEGYPAAWGNLGGIAWAEPYKEGRWETYLEGVYTNPWLYTHYQPETRYSFSRYIFSKREYVLELPLGYETGPDTTRIAIGTGYMVPENWKIKTELSWTREGSTSIYVTYPGGYSAPYPTGYVSPPGTPDQTTWKVSLKGEKQLKNITLGGYGAWLDKWNVKDVENNHIPNSHLSSLEFAVSLKLKY